MLFLVYVFSPSELVTSQAVDKLISDYILLGLTDIVICGGGSFCSLASLHGDRPMLVYPSLPPNGLPLCLQNSRILGPARNLAADGSRCTANLVDKLHISDVRCMLGWS